MVSWFIVVLLCLYFHGPGIVASGRSESSSSGGNNGVTSTGSQGFPGELALDVPPPTGAQLSGVATVSPSGNIETSQRELKGFREAICLAQEVLKNFQNIKKLPNHQSSVPWTYARAWSYQLPSHPKNICDIDSPKYFLLLNQGTKYYGDLANFKCNSQKLLEVAKRYDDDVYQKFYNTLNAKENDDESQGRESGEEITQSFIQIMEHLISMLLKEHGADLH
ncbi:hypothetical protein IWQ61_010749 [Dispira simplex]|nr:hypothetical protein IWQ61_010749 [Dispira simplex]